MEASRSAGDGEKSKKSFSKKKKIAQKEVRQQQDSNLRPVARNRFLVYRLRPLDHVVNQPIATMGLEPMTLTLLVSRSDQLS